MGKEIVKKMMLNIIYEDIYLYQFKQLLQLEDFVKTGSNPHMSPFSTHPSNSDSVHCMGGKHDFVTDKPTFTCKKEDRILKRQELFRNPTFKSNFQMSYDTTLNLLIDLEESFTA